MTDLTDPAARLRLRTLAEQAKARTSGKRALTKRDDGSALLYAPSRGLMRIVVPLAETEHEEGEYLAALEPEAVLALLDLLDSRWQPIDTAPKDGTLFLAWAPGVFDLPAMFSLCAWHPDAGFCIDELRVATHWMPLPAAPQPSTGAETP